ncbi:MAG: exodeoxyribonuclease VII small subunit [Candidatus Kapabacteria bacterium]|nr:exodeoxyribonuclease VII small subunit [Candidatus Kapabacteria bacterium]MDW8224543.1 exodeoxyribonuclease VII small subunit [Bacteroidota bacterium]
MNENSSLSFEGQLARLEEIVALLDRGALPMEQLLQLYEEAMQLIASCRQYLEQAELRVIQIRNAALPLADEESFPETG